MKPSLSTSPALLTGDVDALPDVAIVAAAPASAAFRARGVHDLRAAARHLRDLPYGRISDRARPGLVLEEERGTCTTKHALLSELAAEQGVDVVLRLGLYAMSETNTPGVGAVLARHGLSDIPEAHKIEMHRRFLAEWVRRAHPELTLEAAWRIREACIAALSDPR